MIDIRAGSDGAGRSASGGYAGAARGCRAARQEIGGSFSLVTPATHKDVAGVAFHCHAVLPRASGRGTARPRKHLRYRVRGQIRRRRTCVLAGHQEHCETVVNAWCDSHPDLHRFRPETLKLHRPQYRRCATRRSNSSRDFSADRHRCPSAPRHGRREAAWEWRR